ncbi:MAG: flavodoxin family protein [Chloroflexi bacterium]|nr:flavodoxin family protein [Chloroflexota bacterium]MBM3154658.1 flavodoxin family protein [Chloroflexota bacterium]MBM3172592.1 flavodoxin family protein [Chloroflexota bacterium]MBM3175750.1 flavodoxin family protein [Chloroflexota bacterium]MBM4451041.1 flavodoxin family protein [Chloroflexota bacterium]
MRILGICCSPRKGGNTEILVREALGAAREVGCETELILIAEKDIAPCDGCGSCLATAACKIKDDMQQVYDELERADGIIFGTPVYFINVSAQAKAVIDRTYAFLYSRKLRGKVAAAVVASRRVGVGQVLSLLYSFFNVHRMVIAGGGAGYGAEKGEVKDGVGIGPGSTALGEAKAVGKSVVRLAQQLIKGKS